MNEMTDTGMLETKLERGYLVVFALASDPNNRIKYACLRNNEE